MEFESKLRCSMPIFVNIQHPQVVNSVTEAAFVGTLDLADLEDNSQLFIIKSIEMRLEQGFQHLFGLFIGNYTCGISCFDKFFELFSQ